MKIKTTDVRQKVLDSNKLRALLLIQNQSDEDMYFNLGDTSERGKRPDKGFRLAPGQLVRLEVMEEVWLVGQKNSEFYVRELCYDN